MNDKNLPPDPLTELAKGASQLHELFTEYMNAGFTRAEALQIIIGILSAAATGNSGAQ